MTQILQKGQKSQLSALTPATTLEVGVVITFPGGRVADLSCFGVDADGKLTDDRYFIFYNQKTSPESAIRMLGGGGSDQERFHIELDRLPAKVRRLVFTATIDDGEMSQLERGYLRVAAGSQEVARFPFAGSDLGREKALILGEIYHKDVWRLAATGQGFAGGLSALLAHFGGEEAAPSPPPAPARAPSSAPASAGAGFPGLGVRESIKPGSKPTPLRSIKPKERNMSDLDWEILYPGAFPLLRLQLRSGEQVKAEADAMVAMSPTIDVEGKLEGGLLGGLGRMFTGESFFFQTLAARRGPGEAMLAPATPGDVQVIELGGGETYILQKDGFFASAMSVSITTQMQNLAQGFLSGEGFFVIRASGPGTLFVSSYGQIHPIDLPAGQEMIIDNGHLVAWPERMSYTIEKASSGWISSFTSGEGLVCRFRGPGRVFIQTRNPRGFGSWIRQFLPAQRS